ncbi:MAG: hypothetical protein KC561_14140, partial [Myxococcales bacterium]|nr:hypothetical protein [Myxococcales bacterium]
MTTKGSPSNTKIFLLAVVLGGGICGLVLALATSGGSGPAHSELVDSPTHQNDPIAAAYSDLPVDWERLRGEIESSRRALGTQENGLEEAAFMEAFRQSNASAASGGLTQEQIAAGNELVSVAAQAYVLHRGPDAYRRLGWQVSDLFLSALHQLIGLARESDSDVLSALLQEDPVAQNAREMLGNFLAFAVERGLITPSGEL